MDKAKKLENEISSERQLVKTDSYPMSLSETISNYNDGEINLKPAFQRLFRWKDEQKTRFIESILLGIPIPPIFVSQLKNATWDVVDGVQRLSTILEFTGNLIDPKNPDKKLSELVLTQAKLLPSLEGLTWSKLSGDVQRLFRKSKLTFNIILTDNSIKTQYELFQRLNTGGTSLSDQEVRNCLLIMLDNNFYTEINKLKHYENYVKTISLNEFSVKNDDEYTMELIVRYFIAKIELVDYSEYKINHDLLPDFFDNEISKVLENKTFNLANEIQLFKDVCDFLHINLGAKAFKKLNIDKDEFKGQFSSVVFDMLMSGIAKNFDKIKKLNQEQFITVIKEIYTESSIDTIFASGTKAINRFKLATDFSNNYFSNI